VDEYPLSEFIDECCITDSGARDSVALLYGSFKNWYRERIDSDIYAIAPIETWFGRQLSKRFEKVRSSGLVLYKGIALKK